MKSLNHFKVEERHNTMICIFENLEYGNSFSESCANELEKIIHYVNKKKISNLVITNVGRIFCSGGNLKDYAKLRKRTEGIKINKYIAKVLNSLDKAPFYTVAIVQGDCFGGGIEWISSFDKVYATPNSMFGMWQSRIALSWGWGGGARLKLRLLKKNLKNLLLEGKTFSAYEALDLNLIDSIYPENLILKKTLDHLEKRNALPKAPIGKIKKFNLKHEQKIFESLWMNVEHMEVLKKFIQKLR